VRSAPLNFFFEKRGYENSRKRRIDSLLLGLKQKIGSISETLSVPLVRGALAPPSWHRLFSRAIGTAAQRARPDHKLNERVV
jgi:hypothetical protein